MVNTSQYNGAPMRCSGSGPTQHAVEEGLKQKDGPGVSNKVPVSTFWFKSVQMEKHRVVFAVIISNIEEVKHNTEYERCSSVEKFEGLPKQNVITV